MKPSTIIISALIGLLMARKGCTDLEKTTIAINNSNNFRQFPSHVAVHLSFFQIIANLPTGNVFICKPKVIYSDQLWN
jgi:hypothetical protein